MANLYEQQVSGPYASFCAGGTDNDGNMESCLTLAELAGGGYSLGDSKPEGAGRELRMTAEEITTFARGWLAQNASA
ncbi:MULTISPECIES: DUF397 domain-containing protein [unclassified Streptomyces]|uniref:DUF397 domain-containing protein n=1 Tax=unclassified Streptomyces TaxID=2593676 RepID=UPI000DAD9F9F|nr:MULTISPECIES: DUF397 domain-containing protein [unclassified Streptomyces]PZT76333.1 DUF397 domain-containing protein [Streptomyces sp. AC1-42W]PZT79713.1 DUF397 domain-containing protein [Streptomyces sp. AC1-42T]